MKKDNSYEVLIWIADNGVAHAIRLDNEEFNFLNEDEKHWGYNVKIYGKRTADNVMKMLILHGNINYKVVTFDKKRDTQTKS